VKEHPKSIAGVGRVLLWGGGSLWIGHSAGSGNAHAHHAIQISLALSGYLKLRNEGGAWSELLAAMVHPHHRHQFDGCGEVVAQLFVEPETVHGRALLAAYPQAGIVRLPGKVVRPLIEALLRAHERRVTDESLISTGRQAVAALAGNAPQGRDVDARITQVIEWLRARRGAPVTLVQAARVAHLSPSRFRHLFMAQTGTSLRAYLLWLRIGSAVGAAMRGRSWTDAAQEWGFADSAHLSRTCRRMFGIAPSMLLRDDGERARRS
jgi:AraC-like DNA-binding protein